MNDESESNEIKLFERNKFVIVQRKSLLVRFLVLEFSIKTEIYVLLLLLLFAIQQTNKIQEEKYH